MVVKNGLELVNEAESADGAVTLTMDLRVEVDIPGIDADELDIELIGRVLRIRKRLIGDNGDAKRPELIAVNEKTKIALSLAQTMAATNDPVVIYGETGTGKRLIAETIHNQSARSGQSFVSKPCKVLESLPQLYEKIGCGTLYLDDFDEIGCDCMKVIEKIIDNPQAQPFRLIVAVNQSWEQLKQNNSKMANRLAALRSCVIELAALGERADDIAALARFHCDRICKTKQITGKAMTPEFIQALENYGWPGNVRELVNTLEQVILTAGEKRSLFIKDLPNHIRIVSLQRSAQAKRGL